MNSFVKVLSDILLLLYYLLEGIVLACIPKKFRFKDIRGEIVLITGAGSGIGRLLALHFAKLGARLILWDIDPANNEKASQLIREEGGEAHAYVCDISDPKAVYSVASRVKDEVGSVTVLVNNAGVVTGKRLLECPDNMIIKTFQVNALSHFWTCKAFLPDMISNNHGHIVSIASLAGLSGISRLTDYCSSKFAAVGLAESLRLEMEIEGHSGVKSTVVCPYFINTGMFDGVHTGLFSILEPEYVAQQIVEAVLVNQEILLLPKIFNILLILKSIFSARMNSVFMRLVNVHQSMFNFTGRKKMQ